MACRVLLSIVSGNFLVLQLLSAGAGISARH